MPPMAIYCRQFCIVLAISSVLLLFLRASVVLQLEKQQKMVYTKVTLTSGRRMILLMVQCVLVLIQPYYFLSGLAFWTEDSLASISFEYPVNDLLTLLSLSRIYILGRTLLMLTPYMNNRSNRLCKMYGCRADFSFSMKCLFRQSPVLLIFIFFSVSASLFSYVLYLTERRIVLATGQDFPPTVCNTFVNAVWLILITITTVGYGDYYPHTPLGRLSILFVAIWGTFIISIMLVVVSNTLSMEKNQKRTSNIIVKLMVRQRLKAAACKMVGMSLILRKWKRKLNQIKIECKSHFDRCSRKRLLKDIPDLILEESNVSSNRFPPQNLNQSSLVIENKPQDPNVSRQLSQRSYQINPDRLEEDRLEEDRSQFQLRDYDRSQKQQKEKTIMNSNFEMTVQDRQFQPSKEQIETIIKLVKHYHEQVLQAGKQFSTMRKEFQAIGDDDDIEDEIAAHFLVINRDIEILNQNQEEIINFIHDKFEYHDQETLPRH